MSLRIEDITPMISGQIASELLKEISVSGYAIRATYQGKQSHFEGGVPYSTIRSFAEKHKFMFASGKDTKSRPVAIVTTKVESKKHPKLNWKDFTAKKVTSE